VDYPADGLNITIPNFHNLEFRLEQFDKALTSVKNVRTSDAFQEIRFLQKFAEKLLPIWELQKKKAVTIRVTHNDTKFNNVLLDHQDKGRCVIDLDTIMPGIVHYDFGDGIRTATSTAPEDEQDLHLVALDRDRYRAFSSGYMEATSDTLSKIEKEYLPLSGAYMAFIMGVRFLTDHLNGNVYYKVHYPGHNLARAKNQLKLTDEILRQLGELKIA
jgi:Ser/Thr protein kinase RdoA (MazF antagonist)